MQIIFKLANFSGTFGNPALQSDYALGEWPNIFPLDSWGLLCLLQADAGDLPGVQDG